mmetsp:Transcript_54172/g.128999  ORF Transcript_54172/g.128999 Transcript_54172/m.128999 type:complete len:690 (-) Transcript_54172:34-2103(-)
MPQGGLTLGRVLSATTRTSAAPCSTSLQQDNGVSVPLQVRRGAWTVAEPQPTVTQSHQHALAADAGKPTVVQLERKVQVAEVVTTPVAPAAATVAKVSNLADDGLPAGAITDGGIAVVKAGPLAGALNETIAELKSRNFCGVEPCEVCLRRGSPSVPVAEVEGWITSLVNRLTEVNEALDTRAKACQRQIRDRDEVIRRLHRRLQAASVAEASAGETRDAARTAPAVAGSAPTAEATSTLSRISADLCTSSATAETQKVVAVSTDEDTLSASSMPRVSSTVEVHDAKAMASTPATATQSVREKMSPLALRGISSASTTGGSLNSAREATAPGPLLRESMSSSTGSACQSARRSGVEPFQKTLSRRSSTDTNALEKQQQNIQLRREVASLKKRDSELVGQLRTREQQVEQLTTALRELMAHKNSGPAKRPPVSDGGPVPSPTARLASAAAGTNGCSQNAVDLIHPQDGSLRSLTEEEVVEPGLQAPRAVAPPSAATASPSRSSQQCIPSPASPAGEGARSSRGPRLLPGSNGTAAVVPTLMLSSPTGGSCGTSNSLGIIPGQERRTVRVAAGTTASSQRTADTERGRASAAASGSIGGGLHTSVSLHSPSAAATAGKKDRDRSVGAPPHTPRGKLRDAIGHPTRVAVETPAARRRMASSARTIGRSTSAEDRTTRRIRDGAALNARPLRR